MPAGNPRSHRSVDPTGHGARLVPLRKALPRHGLHPGAQQTVGKVMQLIHALADSGQDDSEYYVECACGIRTWGETDGLLRCIRSGASGGPGLRSTMPEVARG